MARSAYSWRRTGRPDLVAVAMVTALVAGTLAAVLMNSALLVLAKDGVITGLLGAWMLITLALRRPFMLAAGTAIATAKRGVRGGQAWAARWDADPRFRHGIRVVTAVWGVALVLDAVVRVILAYALPIDSVPAATNAQWIVLLAIVYGFFIVYARRNKLLA